MFSAAYINQKGLSNVYSVEKVRSLGMREGIPLEKDNNRWERGALMLSITAKEKNYRKVFSFDYFHLRFSIA